MKMHYRLPQFFKALLRNTYNQIPSNYLNNLPEDNSQQDKRGKIQIKGYECSALWQRHAFDLPATTNSP